MHVQPPNPRFVCLCSMPFLICCSYVTLGSDCCKKNCVRKSCEKPCESLLLFAIFIGPDLWSGGPDLVLSPHLSYATDVPAAGHVPWWSWTNLPSWLDLRLATLLSICNHRTWPFPIAGMDLTLACSGAAGLCPLPVRPLHLPALLSPSAPGLPGAVHHCCSLAQNKLRMHFCF